MGAPPVAVEERIGSDLPVQQSRAGVELEGVTSFVCGAGKWAIYILQNKKKEVTTVQFVHICS